MKSVVKFAAAALLSVGMPLRTRSQAGQGLQSALAVPVDRHRRGGWFHRIGGRHDRHRWLFTPLR